MLKTARPRRSLLYMPGSNTRALDKGRSLPADGLILDLEDAVAPDAKVDAGVELQGPCFVDEGVVLKAGAHVLPYSVIGRQTHVAEGAVIDGSIVWPNGWIGPEAIVRSSILGRSCHIGRNVQIETPVQLGDKTAITDYSRL